MQALERRLTEVVSYMQPGASRWRIILVLTSVSTVIGAWHWLADPATMEVHQRPNEGIKAMNGLISPKIKFRIPLCAQ